MVQNRSEAPRRSRRVHALTFAGSSASDSWRGSVRRSLRLSYPSVQVTFPLCVPPITLSGDRKSTFRLPKLIVKPSIIPNIGLGVFTAETIRKNTYLTIYGGQYLSAKQGKELPPHRRTHLRTITSGHTCVDANVDHNSFTYMDLAEKHCVGGLVNCTHKTGLKANCKYADFQCAGAFPRVDNPDHFDTHSSKHVVIQAIRDMECDEELFLSYDAGYWSIHH